MYFSHLHILLVTILLETDKSHIVFLSLLRQTGSQLHFPIDWGAEVPY